MRRNTACLFLFGSLLSLSGMTHTKKDSIQAGRNYMIDEVVVTGTSKAKKRFLISSAAALVNVITNIFDGCTPAFSISHFTR